MDEKRLIEEFVVGNALKFGKAKLDSIIKSILTDHPEMRPRAKNIVQTTLTYISKINKLSNEEVKEYALQHFPHLLDKPKVIIESKLDLIPLPNAKVGQVILRLAPEPSGYLHIGHGYAFYLNYLYALKYEGRLILRFEDTNPKKVIPRFYEATREALKYLEIKWDEEVIESNKISEYYAAAEKLIAAGEAYVCTCDKEKTHSDRHEGKECIHRSNSIKENKRGWSLMFSKYKEGKVVLRLKGLMTAENAALRDPTIMRIIDYDHPLHDEKRRVWPLYDFAASIEDAKVTHVVRSEEFMQKVDLQNLIRNKLSLPNPTYLHFSRLRINGTPTQKRVVRELIEKGIIDSYEDIRLSNILALRRRGIVPETIKELTRELRGTKRQGTLDWSIILAINRKILEKNTKHLFGVIEPWELIVPDAPEKEVTLAYHPRKKDLGSRTILTNKNFLISYDDANKCKVGDKFRLKDLFNVIVVSVDPEKRVIKGQFIGSELTNIPKWQWVVKSGSVQITMNVPDVLFLESDEINDKSLITIKGFCEPSICELNTFDVVQLERIGYGCVEHSQPKEKIVINMTEK